MSIDASKESLYNRPIFICGPPSRRKAGSNSTLGVRWFAAILLLQPLNDGTLIVSERGWRSRTYTLLVDCFGSYMFALSRNPKWPHFGEWHIPKEEQKI